jgi:endonuclease III
MGALLADGVLQAGLNYRTVVRPRVDRILNLWSDAVRTSDLVRLIHECGAAYLLQWRHEEKVNRFVGLVQFVHHHSVDTVTDFGAWLKNDENVFELRALRGVGPKTVDYLKNLAGVPTIAVDRHIRAFVESSGISCESYAQVRSLVEDAAAVLRLPPSIVDHAIWLHRSSRS